MPPPPATTDADGANAPLLVATGIRKRFRRVVALDGVDLALRSGEALALLGPNGAGKTALLTILAGVSRARAGSLPWRPGAPSSRATWRTSSAPPGTATGRASRRPRRPSSGWSACPRERPPPLRQGPHAPSPEPAPRRAPRGLPAPRGPPRRRRAPERRAEALGGLREPRPLRPDGARRGAADLGGAVRPAPGERGRPEAPRARGGAEGPGRRPGERHPHDPARLHH